MIQRLKEQATTIQSRELNIPQNRQEMFIDVTDQAEFCGIVHDKMFYHPESETLFKEKGSIIYRHKIEECIIDSIMQDPTEQRIAELENRINELHGWFKDFHKAVSDKWNIDNRK